MIKSKLFYLFLLVVGLLSVYMWWSAKPQELHFRQATFLQLPGWEKADAKKSLLAFRTSCKAFLKQQPDKAVGSEYIDLQAKDWHPVCRAALDLNSNSNQKIKAFFQKWFVPVEFFEKKPVEGLFTGYYMPLLRGSLTKTKEYNIPLYGVPSNLISVNLELFDPKLRNRRLVGRVLGNKLLPYYTREEINNGAISKLAPVLVWVNSSIDRSFLEIQGSGIVQLQDGKLITIGYAAQNGAPYTSIAGYLIKKGVMTKDNASMQHIRRYLEAHPKKLNPVLNNNKSFVFFSILDYNAALGAQGVALTPGYSLAVDRKWVPLGVPVWLNTTRPHSKKSKDQRFQRLMVAQDTGGAIRGVVRGDVYWGAGEQAASIAGKMKHKGHYWLLLPRHTVERLHDKIH